MSSVFKKEQADKFIFKHSPKSFKVETSAVAKDFVKMQIEKSSDFQIAEIVSQQAGVSALRQKNVENQVEEAVLVRLKEIEEQAYRQAYDLGFIEGQEKAFAEKTQEFQESLQSLDALMQNIQSLKTGLMKENESIFIKLIYQIAEKIAMRKINDDQAPILEMLKNLTGEVESADHVNIKLSLSDFQFIEELRAKKVKEADFLERVKLQPTSDIQSGGCLVETNYGTIDASVEQRVTKAWATVEAKLPKISGVTDSTRSDDSKTETEE